MYVSHVKNWCGLGGQAHKRRQPEQPTPDEATTPLPFNCMHLFLLGMEETHDVAALEHLVGGAVVLEEEGELPRRRRGRRVDLERVVVVDELGVARVQRQLDNVGHQDDLVADHHVVAVRAQLVLGLDGEQAALDGQKA